MMMGFFSSRKSTEHSPVASRHEKERNRDVISTSPVAVIKSKWYNKSKSKIAPDVPKEDLDTELTARLDQYRRPPAAEPEPNRATDAITKTMAERLNELMKSHAEGMIDDETYRDLRASLFERFQAASHTPTETTHVRIANNNDPSSSTANSTKRHSLRRPDSNFHLAPRPPSMSLSRPDTPARSIRSTTSRASTVATAVTGLLRRGTKQRRPSSDHLQDPNSSYSRAGSPDNASMFSMTSSTAAYSNPSMASVGGGGTRAPSLSSRRTGRSGLTTRSYATPPSSYHRHGHTHGYGSGMDSEVRSKTESEVSMSADLSEYDDKSPAELREAMARTEREGRKLLDAFNGLELTVLTKYRGTGGAMGMAGVGGVSGGTGVGWTHVKHPNEMGLMPADGYGYGYGSPSSSTRRRTARPGARGGSSSSLHSAAPIPGQLAPSTKARSLSLSNNSSSIRSRSPQPPTVHEEGQGPSTDMNTDDPETTQLHKEMEEIRRRRAQVAQRYETRLEMLRVKLKSAELRDKVAR
ncbi:hypothetical protein RSOLAG22IIIB_04943 [Rhizoctonia solani]|uniref:Uncharacterized protein n=1 Tax=Rhizoctonia solani TaxID=456999 RepID=A0A0K6G2C9_9AGAM|nr:hypothetical protein RSOLAG22IIIB_04943 [Rhizoctonia solani]